MTGHESPSWQDATAVTIAADSESTTDTRVSQAFFIVEPNREQLTRIGDLLEAGDPPLDGKRHIHWNSVSSSWERIEPAKRDWTEGRFSKVPGDEVEFVPLPA